MKKNIHCFFFIYFKIIFLNLYFILEISINLVNIVFKSNCELTLTCFLYFFFQKFRINEFKNLPFLKKILNKITFTELKLKFRHKIKINKMKIEKLNFFFLQKENYIFLWNMFSFMFITRNINRRTFNENIIMWHSYVLITMI